MTVQIKFKSKFDLPNHKLEDLAFMEGGAYISDWLRDREAYSWKGVEIPVPVAQLIQKALDIKLNNKEFVRITQDGAVTGMSDTPCIAFLYMHDFSASIYTIR